MRTIAERDLDRLLAVQIAIAWAGERGEPRRLAWWDTDLVDEDAAGDLFARLLPRTGAWAALAAVREAARRVDLEARASVAGDAGALVTVFSLGFELDERLDDRLASLTRSMADRGAMPWPFALDRFSYPAVRAAFVSEPGNAQDTPPGGRALAHPMPASPVLAVRQLAAELFADASAPARYPLVYFRRARR